MSNVINTRLKKTALCLAMSLSMSGSVLADVFEQPHALNINIFDTQTNSPISDGLRNLEVNILDNENDVIIGTVPFTCSFVNGMCTIPIDDEVLGDLTELSSISFEVKVPGVLDQHLVSYNVSNVSISAELPNLDDDSFVYDVKPVLYARIADNVTGNITPLSVDTSTVSIDGKQVINENGEWVGEGGVEGPQGPQGETGAQGPQG
ncbi:collagen-like triple helix repeat-containing protein, partial [Vibrio owensii]|uniref:collagen-like triple helix repeat-containing protein n=1 Tax=Vibrio owensii TaxID=696485 RepID=UPI0005873C0D